MKKDEWKLRLDDALSALGEDPWLYQQVLRRAAKEEPIMKKKISIGIIVAVILAVLTMSVAAAAASGWDVLQFLFSGQRRETPAMEYTVVSQEAASDGACLRIESAVYDGRMLAFDYTIENTAPDIPMYCRVEGFTANGVRIRTDFTDDFNEQWLPGLFSDGSWQDGELILLPEEVQGADRLHVEMTVALYRPVRPVYWMEEFDPAEAQQKAEEGYYVIAEGEGFVVYDEEQGQWFHGFMGPLPKGMGEYKEARLTVSFDVAKPDLGFRALEAREAYETESCTAVYETAEITPLGLYLTVNVHPREDSPLQGPLSFELTDGEGSSLLEQDWDKFWPTAGDVIAAVDQNALLARFSWVGITAEDLPDTISLTCILDSGEKLVFPVRVR